MRIHDMKAVLTAICFALSTMGAAGTMAEDNVYVSTPKPKLNAGQFAANCAMIGGSPTNLSNPNDGGAVVNCTKKSSGTNVTCSWDGAGMVCVGSGPRPQ
jgi:hypothetical protein